MKTVELIAAFEHSYTTSFQHTARVKWSVDFKTSDIQSIFNNLQQLKENLTSTTPQPCKVGYELTLEDVERVEVMLKELQQRWKQQTNIPPHPKLYTFLYQLRELETPSTTDAAKEIVREVLAPKPKPQPSKEAEKQAKIEQLKQARVLDMLRNQNKNG